LSELQQQLNDRQIYRKFARLIYKRVLESMEENQEAYQEWLKEQEQAEIKKIKEAS